MGLEDKIAYHIDLGLTTYPKLKKIQAEIVSQKKENPKIPDVYLSAEVHPHIDFGANRAKNIFSDEITKQLQERFKETLYDEKGWLNPDVLEILEKEGVAGLPFTVSARGGGATTYAPGQFLYFPSITLGEDMNIGTLNETVDYVMLHSMNEFLPSTLKEMGFSETLQGNYKDLHVESNGRSYKLGSKGFAVQKGIGFGGFNLYFNNSGLAHIDKVYVCGFHPDDVGSISAERLTGKKYDISHVTPPVLQNLKRKMGYGEIKEITLSEFYKI